MSAVLIEILKYVGKHRGERRLAVRNNHEIVV